MRNIAEEMEQEMARQAVSPEGLEYTAELAAKVSDVEIFAAISLMMNSEEFMALPAAGEMISLVAGLNTALVAQIKEIQSIKSNK